MNAFLTFKKSKVSFRPTFAKMHRNFHFCTSRNVHTTFSFQIREVVGKEGKAFVHFHFTLLEFFIPIENSTRKTNKGRSMGFLALTQWANKVHQINQFHISQEVKTIKKAFT